VHAIYLTPVNLLMYFCVYLFLGVQCIFKCSGLEGNVVIIKIDYIY
jgi:hypothetical protein